MAYRRQLQSIQLGSDATWQGAQSGIAALGCNHETASGIQRVERQNGKRQASMKAAFSLYLHIQILRPAT